MPSGAPETPRCDSSAASTEDLLQNLYHGAQQPLPFFTSLVYISYPSIPAEARREHSAPAQHKGKGAYTVVLWEEGISHDNRELQGKRLSACWYTQINSLVSN